MTLRMHVSKSHILLINHNSKIRRFRNQRQSPLLFGKHPHKAGNKSRNPFMQESKCFFVLLSTAEWRTILVCLAELYLSAHHILLGCLPAAWSSGSAAIKPTNAAPNGHATHRMLQILNRKLGSQGWQEHLLVYW